MITAICDRSVCSKEFKTFPSYKQRYCCQRCASIDTNTRRGSRQRVKKICQNCELEFEIYPYESKFRRYCGRKCSDRGFVKELVSGVRKPNTYSHGIRVEYGGAVFRSLIELSCAKELDRNQFQWLYEPERFMLGDTSYLPDFFLPEVDVWIECKGTYRPEGWDEKIQLFRQTGRTLVLYPS